MKILYDLNRVLDVQKTNTKEYIEIVNVSKRPTLFENQLIQKQVLISVDIWFLLAARVKFNGSLNRLTEFKTQIQVMQKAAVTLMFWIQYDSPCKNNENIIVGDDFLKKQNLQSLQYNIIQFFGLKRCTNEKFLRNFREKQQYYTQLIQETIRTSFGSGLNVQNSFANYSVLSRVFNPLVSINQADVVKTFADEQNAVFISELPKIERIVLHCIIQSQQINFHISNMLETKCTPYEALTQYYVCKVMNLENNSKNRQAIVKAFQGLAGRRIKFITSKGINVYSIFPTSFLDFKTGGTSYTLNPDILQNTELIETIKSYYNTEKLTGFDARHLLNSKIDVNIALTAIEIINEIKLKDAAQSCFSKKNISNRMTYHPQPNWWRSLCNALNKFGYQVIINPKNKDEFIVDVK